jgi:kynureninase
MSTSTSTALTLDETVVGKWREEFPILSTSTYMVSHSLGAMPRRTATALAEYTETFATRGVRAWHEGWWEMPITVGNLIASIIGAGVGEVVCHQNVSVCQSIVTSCLDFTGERNTIVTDGLNFPSNDYIYNELSRRGARVVSVPSRDGMTVVLEDMLAAIDEHTQLVSVSHVAFRSSAVQDLRAITERAHAVGALVIADLYQSAGILPVDVRSLGVDFATGGSVKWLLGGPGVGYLYIRRELWPTLRPMMTGWQAHRAPFAFQGGTIDFADDAFRFLSGTPNIPALYAARSGYEIVAEIGVPAIRQRSIHLTERLIAAADAAGVPVNSQRDPARRGGLVVFNVPDASGARIVSELDRRGIVVDHRPGAGIRVAPHFYSTEAEIDFTIKELADILKTIPAS